MLPALGRFKPTSWPDTAWVLTHSSQNQPQFQPSSGPHFLSSSGPFLPVIAVVLADHMIIGCLGTSHGSQSAQRFGDGCVPPGTRTSATDISMKLAITKIIHHMSFDEQVFSTAACMWSLPSVTYMRQWTGSALVQIMACHLIGAKPLPEPMLIYYQLDPWDQTFLNFLI